ncbi:MAG: hypothetical protein KC615_17080 [Anaerolineae bacterium]|nr:hypothetical protein [Anaerolineae bacterium]
MLRLAFFAVILAIASACTPTPPAVAPTSQFDTFVTIDLPRIGTIIYADTIYVAGTSNASMEDGFLIQVITANSDVIADGSVQPTDGHWDVQLPHSYTGDPTEITIVASLSDGQTSAELDLASAVLSPEVNRPDGIYGLILQPTNGDTGGGEQIPVFGVVSGLSTGEIVIGLTMGGDEISLATLAIDYPNSLDEIPWQVDLPTEDTTGPVTLTLSYKDETGNLVLLDEIELVLTAVAG